MKKRTLLAVALSGTLAVGAFAYGVDNQQGMDMMGTQKGMMARGMARHHCANNGINHMRHSKMGYRGMHMFSKLNLTSEQRYQFSILRDEMRLEMKKQMHNTRKMRQMGTFFKGDSFDKDAFKKQMEKRHEKMLDLRANYMDKAFKILTKEQKAQLRANLK